MKSIIFSLLLFPMLAFSYNFNDFFPGNTISGHLDELAQCLVEKNVQEGFDVLNRWYEKSPQDVAYINGMCATLYLMDGQLKKSKEIMQTACAQLSQTSFPKELLDTIIELFISLPNDTIDNTYEVENSLASGRLHLCKRKQSKGIRFKFWVGVAQVVGGCIMMPFNPVAGGALIGAGASCVIDATSDALDNKERWEQELNDRQGITPENFDPEAEPSSFYDSRSSTFQLYAC
jgi:hypothetical protein